MEARCEGAMIEYNITDGTSRRRKIVGGKLVVTSFLLRDSPEDLQLLLVLGRAARNHLLWY